MSHEDTITAIATPCGRGGVGVLRISGSLVTVVAYELLGKLPRPRQAEYLPFFDENNLLLDRGIVLFFPGPYSFTGEDVLELQGHGSPVILDLLLQRIISVPGVRIARPGEFSERAFLNDKLDLSQAEAIADLIDASSAQAAKSAANSLSGMFSSRVYELVEALTNLRTFLEAGIDFPDEETNFFSNGKIGDSVNNIISSLERVRAEAHQGRLLRDGIKVVIAGKPNAGKSSLLNTLVGYESAIVTAIAGTTRDVLREHIHLDGMPLHIIDTAGLCDAVNEVECLGIERAWSEIKQADHVLLVVDSTIIPFNSSDMLWPEFFNRLPSLIPVTVVRNKADLTGERVAIGSIGCYSLITISAQSGAGVDLLRSHLKQCVGFTGATNGVFLARRRHLEALETASIHLQHARKQLINSCCLELVAEDLRLAQRYLNEITGEFSNEALLDRIFSSFCIGK